MKQFDVMMAHSNIQMSNVTWVSTWQEQAGRKFNHAPPPSFWLGTLKWKDLPKARGNRQSYQFQLNGKGTHYWEMSRRSEESGFRTKASQMVLHHQGKLRLKKRERHSEGKQERVQSQMNICPGVGWRLIVSDWEYLLKLSVFTSSNSAFHLLEYILYHTTSLMRAKYLYTKISTATLSMEEGKYSE